jgi:hypothetical protein
MRGTEESRTPDLLVRRQPLYPVKSPQASLAGLCSSFHFGEGSFSGLAGSHPGTAFLKTAVRITKSSGNGASGISAAKSGLRGHSRRSAHQYVLEHFLRICSMIADFLGLGPSAGQVLVQRDRFVRHSWGHRGMNGSLPKPPPASHSPVRRPPSTGRSCRWQIIQGRMRLNETIRSANSRAILLQAASPSLAGADRDISARVGRRRGTTSAPRWRNFR